MTRPKLRFAGTGQADGLRFCHCRLRRVEAWELALRAFVTLGFSGQLLCGGRGFRDSGKAPGFYGRLNAVQLKVESVISPSTAWCRDVRFREISAFSAYFAATCECRLAPRNCSHA